MSFGYIPDYKGKSFVKDLYLRVFGYPYPPRRNEARLVFKLLNPQKSERILDIGCGDGVWNNELRKRGIDVVGIDISRHDIYKAKDRAKRMGLNCKLIQCDAQCMPFGDETFDKIFSISVIEHIQSDEKVFYEAFRVLKPGGVVVISVPRNTLPLLIKMFLRMPKHLQDILGSCMLKDARDEKEYRAKIDEKFRHFRTYNLEELIRRVESNGFEVKKVAYNVKFFGSFFGGLIHSLKFFEWEKNVDTGYTFKNPFVFAILFIFAYPLYILDDLCIFKKGHSIVLKSRKHRLFQKHE